MPCKFRFRLLQSRIIHPRSTLFAHPSPTGRLSGRDCSLSTKHRSNDPRPSLDAHLLHHAHQLHHRYISAAFKSHSGVRWGNRWCLRMLRFTLSVLSSAHQGIWIGAYFLRVAGDTWICNWFDSGDLHVCLINGLIIL